MSGTGVRRSVLLLAALALQILVPLVAYFRPPPAMFGFQMYSGRGSFELRVLDASGQRIKVDVHPLVANFRGEVDWTRRLPEYLCAHVDGAASARVRSHGRVRQVSCSG